MNINPKTRVPRALTALALSLTAGCAVGPNFKTPAAPAVSDYGAHPATTTATAPDVAGGEAQRFVKGADITGDWWTLFHSAPLNELIEHSLAQNPDLKAAQAALTVARESVLAQRGAYFPSVTGGASATRQSQSPSLAPTPSSNALLYNLFTAQVSVSYVPDVFGLNRRTMESLRAEAEGVRFQMLATYTTLTANVVVAAIGEASLEQQIDATRQIIEMNSAIEKTVEYQFSKGYASGLDVAAQQSLLAQVAATLPPLVKQLAQQRDLLAVLAGRFPSEAPEARFDLATLSLPADLPMSLPSALVRQRPDVRQAEANLHDASAKIGIAVANRLPNFLLTGNTGSTALTFAELFKSGTGFWGLGAEATAPIFAGGTLLHQERGAKAAYVQAAEQYRSTVLTAFQNVADTLAALEQDAEGLKAAASAAAAAKVTMELAERQWHSGYASFPAFILAEQAYLQARTSLVQAQANRFSDTAALFQALGGGWWHRADLANENHEN